MKTIPSQAYLREAFDYDAESGFLRWRPRPRNHFRSDKAWKAFNTRFVGKIIISSRYVARTKSMEEAVTIRKAAEANLGYHPNHGRGA